jgi:hypothetical protein
MSYVRGNETLKNRIFYLEADDITQRDFELIHIYIRKTLEKKNENMTIRSIPLDNFALLETLIKRLSEY